MNNFIKSDKLMINRVLIRLNRLNPIQNLKFQGCLIRIRQVSLSIHPKVGLLVIHEKFGGVFRF